MDKFEAAIDLGFNLVVGIGKNFGSKFIDKIKSRLTGLYDSGKSILDSFKRGISDGFDKITNFVTEKIKGVRDLFPFSQQRKTRSPALGGCCTPVEALGQLLLRALDRR